MSIFRNSFREKASGFFMKNLLRLAAVVLAIQIWVAIRLQLQVDREVYIPVTVQTQNDEIPLGTTSPEKVTVSLAGGKSTLNNLAVQDLKLVS